MNGAEATKKWEDDKAILMAELTALDAAEKRQLILGASTYRSGEDSCNSIYMGGMAHSMLRHALGGTNMDNLDVLLAKASDKHLDRALEVCASYIKTMRENPVRKCPCCGQIVSAKEKG